MASHLLEEALDELAQLSGHKEKKKKNARFGADEEELALLNEDTLTPLQEVRRMLRALRRLDELQERLPKVYDTEDPTEEATAAKFAAFGEWLAQNGCPGWSDDADSRSYDIVHGLAEGSGLQARRDIAAGEQVVEVPANITMTVERALQDPLLGPLVESDPFLQRVPSAVLSLYLLNECADKRSFWKPYLAILPSRFGTPLFWQHRDFAALEGSPAFTDAWMTLKQAVRAYCYLHPLVKQFAIAHRRFSWANYAWATSVLHTRQNEIPSANGTTQLALIPVWDMCNHSPTGTTEITTFFDTEKQATVCNAKDAVSEGEQFCIFYGPRPNSKLLIHSGFVTPENSFDTLRFSMSVQDAVVPALVPALSGLLLANQIATECTFFLNNAEIDPSVLLFARVLALDQSEIKIKGYKNVFEAGTRISYANDARAVALILSIIDRLESGYPTSLEEDEAAAQANGLTPQLHLCMLEKQMLRNNRAMVQAQGDAWEKEARKKKAKRERAARKRKEQKAKKAAEKKAAQADS